MQMKVDLEALGAALLSRGAEWSYYLDLRSGDIRCARGPGFREEGDEWSEEEVDLGVSKGFLVPVEPLPYQVEYDWMLEFVASLSGCRAERLGAALRSRRPLWMFREALVGEPRASEQWRASRGRHVAAAAAAWLARRGLRP